MLRRLAISILILMSAMVVDAQGFGQKMHNAFTEKPDTSYIESLDGLFGVQFSVFRKNSDFSIDDIRNLSQLQYNCCDSSASISLGMSYKWLSLKLGLSMGLLNRDRTGRKFDLSTQIFTQAVTIKLSGNIYTGYCLYNSNSILKDWSGDSFYERPDIKTNVVRVSADYYFNHTQYSRKALTSQGELQRKTAGSFFTGVVLNRNVVSGDSSLIPSMVNDTLFSYHNQMNRVRNMFVGIDGGYAITFVTPSKWFINGQFGIGFAYNRCLLQYSGEPDRNYVVPDAFFQCELNVGYNSRRLYFGMGGSLFAIDSPMDDEGANINNMNVLVQATLAYRFKLDRDYGVVELFREKWRGFRCRN